LTASWEANSGNQWTVPFGASGQSLTTWSIFAGAGLLWLIYGLLNRKAAIYAGKILALAMNLLMVNGIFMHAGWTY